MNTTRKSYPSDVSNGHWEFLLPYLTLMREDAPRAQVAALAEKVREGYQVEFAFVDQGYTGENAATQASDYGIKLEVVKHTEPKKGFILLPRRWVVERTSVGLVACVGSLVTMSD
jgi:transposase